MSERFSTSVWTRTLSPVAAIVLLGAGAASYEPPGTFQASKILPAAAVKGPHHKVADVVKADGYYQHFDLTTDFGAMDAEGRTVLHARLSEIDALARLEEVSKGEVFAKAAGGAVVNVGKGVAAVVKDPEGTVKGIGGGIKRVGTNLGRKGKRAADSATQDDKKPEGSDKPTEEKAIDAAGGAANSVLGVNSSARKWAQKLGVDPYTTNPVLHDALVDVGRIDKAGSIAAKVVVPIPAVVSTTATVGGLVWGADPEEVRKTNEGRLASLGVSKEAAGHYLINGNYTLTNQTRFIAALDAVKAKGCADYVAAAAEADDQREALFFVESAELLAGLHKAQPVSALLMDSRAMVARAGTAAIALLPLDWVRWTEPFEKASVEIASRAKQELGAKSLELRLAGTATPAAKQGLGAAGWTVKEGNIAGLMVKPVK